MEQFTIYYGTPEGRETKIGVDCDYPRRIKMQKISDPQILEVHTCVYEVSRREMELQREYGVRVDNVPYYKIYFANKKAEKRAKIGETNSISQLGNTNRLGHIHTEETRAKISAANLGNSYNLGRICSEETRAKISASTKGLKRSEETKAKMSLAFTGSKRTEEAKSNMRGPRATIQCTHCQRVGGISNMKRYHFDNCKHKQHE